MILTCPACATSYSAPDAAFAGGGRKVRCQACGETWRASLDDEPLELTADVPAEPTSFGRREEAPDSLAETPAPELPKAYRARAEQQRRIRRAATHGAVWAGLASAFALVLGAGWLFRVDVVEMYPRAAAAYAMVGSPVNPVGLDFEAVGAKTLPSDPGKVVVSGSVRNVRDREIVAPSIRLALLDEHGVELAHRIVRIDAAPVLPGKVQGFAAVMPDPGGRAADVGVTFVLDEAEPAAAHAPAPGHAPAVRRPPQATEGEAHAGAMRPALAPDVTHPGDMHPVEAEPIAEPIAETATSEAGHALRPAPAVDPAHAAPVAAHHG